VETNPDNITGLTVANLSMILRNTLVTPPVDTTGTGTFAIVTANPAVVNYTFSNADVAAVWSGSLVPQATFSGGGLAVYDPITFGITDV
jgi:hypothetical protein